MCVCVLIFLYSSTSTEWFLCFDYNDDAKAQRISRIRFFTFCGALYGSAGGSCSLAALRARNTFAVRARRMHRRCYTPIFLVYTAMPLIYSTELPVFGHLMHHGHIAIPLHTWLHASANFETALFHPPISSRVSTELVSLIRRTSVYN